MSSIYVLSWQALGERELMGEAGGSTEGAGGHGEPTREELAKLQWLERHLAAYLFGDAHEMTPRYAAAHDL